MQESPQPSVWKFVPLGGPRQGASPIATPGELQVAESPRGLDLTETRLIDAADPHLEAHFPAFKIFPGVFVIESLRRAVRTILADPDGQAPDLTAIHSVRFLAPLVPGDSLRLTATLAPAADGELDAEAVARRGDGTAAVRLRGRFGSCAPGETAPDSDAIRRWLPHGHPMVLVDRILALDAGRSIVAVKAVSCTEPCYRDVPRDAPPDAYAYPTPLVLESFGQAAALLWMASVGRDPDDLLILNAMRDCRIEGQAYPGDTLTHVAHIDRVVGDTVLVGGETWIGARRTATIGSMMASRGNRAALERAAAAHSTGATRPLTPGGE